MWFKLNRFGCQQLCIALFSEIFIAKYTLHICAEPLPTSRLYPSFSESILLIIFNRKYPWCKYTNIHIWCKRYSHPVLYMGSIIPF